MIAKYHIRKRCLIHGHDWQVPEHACPDHSPVMFCARWFCTAVLIRGNTHLSDMLVRKASESGYVPVRGFAR